jgi:hypothetical protein
MQNILTGGKPTKVSASAFCPANASTAPAPNCDVNPPASGNHHFQSF